MHSVGPWPQARCAISGTREGSDHVERWMLAYWAKHGPVVWVLGGARGVDSQARWLCDARGWPYVELPAKWSEFGKPAGTMRNYEMTAWAIAADKCACLAFPGAGPGTRHCINAMRLKHVPVYICRR